MALRRATRLIAIFAARTCFGVAHVTDYGDATLFIQSTALLNERQPLDSSMFDTPEMPPILETPTVPSSPTVPSGPLQMPYHIGSNPPMQTPTPTVDFPFQFGPPAPANMTGSQIQQLTDFTENIIKENHQLRAKNQKWTDYGAKLKEQNIMMRDAYEEYPKISANVKVLAEQNKELTDRNDRLQKDIDDLQDQIKSLKSLTDNANSEWQQQLQVAYRDMESRNQVLKDKNDVYIKENTELNEKYTKIHAQAHELQSTFRSLEKENRDIKADIKNCKAETAKLEKDKAQVEASVTQGTKLQADMANEIMDLKHSKEELQRINQECRRSMSMND